MSGEQQQLDITNPNPNSPHADASISMYEDSRGFDGLGARPAFELDRAAGPQSGMIPQTTDSTTYEHVKFYLSIYVISFIWFIIYNLDV